MVASSAGRRPLMWGRWSSPWLSWRGHLTMAWSFCLGPKIPDARCLVSDGSRAPGVPLALSPPSGPPSAPSHPHPVPGPGLLPCAPPLGLPAFPVTWVPGSAPPAALSSTKTSPSTPPCTHLLSPDTVMSVSGVEYKFSTLERDAQSRQRATSLFLHATPLTPFPPPRRQLVLLIITLPPSYSPITSWARH